MEGRVSSKWTLFLPASYSPEKSGEMALFIGLISFTFERLYKLECMYEQARNCRNCIIKNYGVVGVKLTLPCEVTAKMLGKHLAAVY